MKLTVYHATDAQRASMILREGFRLDVNRRTDPGDFGLAAYFTNQFSRAKAMGRVVLTADLELRNPIQLKDSEAYELVIDKLGFDTVHGRSHPGGRQEAAKLAREYFLGKGHDALLSTRSALGEVETEAAVYDLNSIRNVRL